MVASLAPKYSSPRLRPPTSAMRLSAIQLLLCMRRLMRLKLRHGLAEACERSPARGERIEQAHVDVRVRIQRGEAEILGSSVQVVDQQAHAHTALGGGKELRRERKARGIRVPDVGLHVDAASHFGGAPAQRERLAPVAYQAEARLTGMRGLDRCNPTPEIRVFGERHCRFDRQGRACRQLRARAQNQHVVAAPVCVAVSSRDLRVELALHQCQALAPGIALHLRGGVGPKIMMSVFAGSTLSHGAKPMSFGLPVLTKLTK